MHLHPLSSLYTLDMFPALVGFVVSVVDIHWRLVSYELHHKLCCTCVWSRFKPMLQPDQNLRKLVNPKENDWWLICLQPFYRVLSSGCTESAEQPSLMEKGSRMTLYYSMTIKEQCTWSCPLPHPPSPPTGTHVQHGAEKDSPRWTAYIHQYREGQRFSGIGFGMLVRWIRLHSPSSSLTCVRPPCQDGFPAVHSRRCR